MDKKLIGKTEKEIEEMIRFTELFEKCKASRDSQMIRNCISVFLGQKDYEKVNEIVDYTINCQGENYSFSDICENDLEKANFKLSNEQNFKIAEYYFKDSFREHKLNPSDIIGKKYIEECWLKKSFEYCCKIDVCDKSKKLMEEILDIAKEQKFWQLYLDCADFLHLTISISELEEIAQISKDLPTPLDCSSLVVSPPSILFIRS